MPKRNESLSIVFRRHRGPPACLFRPNPAAPIRCGRSCPYNSCQRDVFPSTSGKLEIGSLFFLMDQSQTPSWLWDFLSAVGSTPAWLLHRSKILSVWKSIWRKSWTWPDFQHLVGDKIILHWKRPDSGVVPNIILVLRRAKRTGAHLDVAKT
jgi:hypothetical protein